MSRRDIVQRARIVIARELAVTPAKITEDADFRADLSADSLDIVTLTAALEEEFNVAITDSEASFCETVGTAIDLIEGKLERQACGARLSGSSSTTSNGRAVYDPRPPAGEKSAGEARAGGSANRTITVATTGFDGHTVYYHTVYYSRPRPRR